MKLPPLHRRLLADALDTGVGYELALAGGYAVQAHGLVARPSQDLDFATRHPGPGRSPLSMSGRSRRGSSSWIRTAWSPATDDAPLVTDGSRSIPSMAMRALVDRGLPQDVIDVHAACRYYTVIELEQLGDFDLRDRLESVVWVSDEEFAVYGLSREDIAELRRWALEWESDLGLRLAEDYDDPEDADD